MRRIPVLLLAWARGPGLPVVGLLLGVGLFLLGLLAVGKATRNHVRRADRDTVLFAEIDCEPPPGHDRADFLGEVQYVGSLPARLHLLDPDLAPRLAEAFGRHPWVEAVERVEVAGPRQVRVRLRYRVPALRVRRPDVSAPRSAAWIVDGEGRLLGETTADDNLPLLSSSAVPAPAGPRGTAWGDLGVEAAARTAGFLREYQDRLRLGRVATGAGGVEWSTAAGTCVHWGHAPGAESADEAPAAEKLRRLLEFCRQHGGLDGPGGPLEHDVRPRERAAHRPRS